MMPTLSMAGSQMQRLGDWSHGSYTDDFTDEKSYLYAIINNQKDTFLVDCNKKFSVIALKPKFKIMIGPRQYVSYRIDKRETIEGFWAVFQNKMVTKKNQAAFKLLRALPDAEKMIFRVDGQTYKFSVSGSKDIVADIEKNCGWNKGDIS